MNKLIIVLIEFCFDFMFYYELILKSFSFRFNKTFHQTTKQDEIFDDVAKPVIDR